jgi:hypothetical protein
MSDQKTIKCYWCSKCEDFSIVNYCMWECGRGVDYIGDLVISLPDCKLIKSNIKLNKYIDEYNRIVGSILNNVEYHIAERLYCDGVVSIHCNGNVWERNMLVLRINNNTSINDILKFVDNTDENRNCLSKILDVVKWNISLGGEMFLFDVMEQYNLSRPDPKFAGRKV